MPKLWNLPLMREKNWVFREYTCNKLRIFREKFYKGSKLPTARGAFQFHLKWNFHQLRTRVTTDRAQLNERDPNFYGLTLKKKKKFVPWIVDVSIAPTDLVEFISSNYKGMWLIFSIIYLNSWSSHFFNGQKLNT